MKKVKKKNEYEATISDVLEAVQTGFAKVDERFDKIEGTIERHESLLSSLVNGQDQLRDSINILDHRVSKTQNRVEDIADSLGDITRVADKDRVSTLDHERRIRHLEKAQA